MVLQNITLHLLEMIWQLVILNVWMWNEDGVVDANDMAVIGDPNPRFHLRFPNTSGMEEYLSFCFLYRCLW